MGDEGTGLDIKERNGTRTDITVDKRDRLALMSEKPDSEKEQAYYRANEEKEEKANDG
jgi:hypothetical protein